MKDYLVEIALFAAFGALLAMAIMNDMRIEVAMKRVDFLETLVTQINRDIHSTEDDK
jgi:hypothetical protein